MTLVFGLVGFAAVSVWDDEKKVWDEWMKKKEKEWILLCGRVL
jgi:hypothetical protein